LLVVASSCRSILGKNPDSKDVKNQLTTVTATIPKGSRRVSVSWQPVWRRRGGAPLLDT
jgi:hypothetical protein